MELYKYIDYGQFFLDLYNDQEEIMISLKDEVECYRQILEFKKNDYNEFELLIEECNVSNGVVTFVFGYDFNDANESCNQSTTAEYVIEYNDYLGTFDGCYYEQG